MLWELAWGGWENVEALQVKGDVQQVRRQCAGVASERAGLQAQHVRRLGAGATGGRAGRKRSG